MNNSKQKKRATIIITDKYSHETKVYNINQKHIENFGLYKKIFFSITGIAIGLLVGLLGYIRYETHQTNQAHKELVDLKHSLSNAATRLALSNGRVKQMWNNLNKADSSLQKIKKYLIDRNVKPISKAARGNKTDIGGEYYPLISPGAIKQKADELAALLRAIESTPIGLPHEGRLTSDFGARGNPFENGGSEFHPGLDVSGNIGDPIHATADGSVIFAGWKGGYGNCVILKHGNNYGTLYGHMSKILVHEGQRISAGTVIGLLGSTGRSTGPHVHYEVIYNNEKKNPIQFININ